MNEKTRPEHIFDDHRGLTPGEGMRYWSDTGALRFVDNDATQAITVKTLEEDTEEETRRVNHTIELRGHESLADILEDSDESDAQRVQDRIDHYEHLERGAMNVLNLRGYYQDGVIERISKRVREQQRPWRHNARYDWAKQRIQAYNTPHSDPNNKRNISTQNRVRQKLVRRGYAVTTLYKGVLNVLDDMMSRLNDDWRVLNAHENQSGIDAIYEATKGSDLTGRIESTLNELDNLQRLTDTYTWTLEAQTDDFAQALPSPQRSKIKDNYEEMKNALT